MAYVVVMALRMVNATVMEMLILAVAAEKMLQMYIIKITMVMV